MRDERLPYLFRKKNAIACVETAKYVVPLEKKTKQLFVERVDDMAKKMNAILKKAKAYFTEHPE